MGTDERVAARKDRAAFVSALLLFLLGRALLCSSRTLGTGSVRSGRCFCLCLGAGRSTAFRRAGCRRTIGLHDHSGGRGLLATCQRKTDQGQSQSRQRLHGFYSLHVIESS